MLPRDTSAWHPQWVGDVRGRRSLPAAIDPSRKPILKRQSGWDCTRFDDVDVHEPGYIGSSPQNLIKISAVPSYYSTA